MDPITLTLLLAFGLGSMGLGARLQRSAGEKGRARDREQYLKGFEQGAQEGFRASERAEADDDVTVGVTYDGEHREIVFRCLEPVAGLLPPPVPPEWEQATPPLPALLAQDRADNLHRLQAEWAAQGWAKK